MATPADVCVLAARVCCTSAYLSVVGQVIGTVHELLQGAAGPVGALVAGGQLLGGRGAAVAHVQGGFPRGSPLHMPPLAEVARHRVPQQGDVVELPVGCRRTGGGRERCRRAEKQTENAER